MAEQPKGLTKKELSQLIKKAAAGDDESARRLISPFVTPEETVLEYGISACFGLIKTYDFLFVTDRRIGDLEITPLTGGLNVEIAYLQKIDALVLSQPAFPILLRLGMVFLYVYGAIGAFGLTGFAPDAFSVIIGLILAAIAVALVHFVVNPLIKRTFLRLRKSGIFLKLYGNPVGVLIFADRDKFQMLTRVASHVTAVKRQLDKTAM